jgi:hypothetical protein
MGYADSNPRISQKSAIYQALIGTLPAGPWLLTLRIMLAKARRGMRPSGDFARRI